MEVKDKEKWNNALKGWKTLSAISSMVFHTVHWQINEGQRVQYLHSLNICVCAGVPYSSLNDLYDISYDYGEAENMIGEQKQKK